MEFDNKKDDEENRLRKCENCRRELNQGEDILVLYRAVLGPTIAVPLERKRLIHIDECFKNYVCNSEGPKLPRRIP